MRDTNSPQERRYMIRWSIGFWVGITLFLAGLFLLPHPYGWFLWIPYGIALPLSLIATNRGLARIRAEVADRNG